VVVQEIFFNIHIPVTPEGDPPGYLFLCPANDLQTGCSSFLWPDCPAYWSLDPAGVQRLSLEEATGLGFPSIQLTIELVGHSSDARVYADLRQFHQVKGFDPESQDIASHLGYPLLQLSAEIDPLFAHGKFTISLQLPVVPHNNE
jgi:hypothetical protein